MFNFFKKIINKIRSSLLVVKKQKLNTMKTIKILGLLLSFVIVMTSCESDDAVEEPQTIAEIASADPNFSTLVAALDRTGLVPVVSNPGTYTVFAPTNAAFEALGVDLNTISDDDLREILLYHVLGSTVMSGDIASGQTYVSTAAETGPEGNALSMLIENNGGVKINGTANVTTADIGASNGVIHVVDAVIMPLSIVGHAQANSSFSELVSALSTADLVSTLEGDGPFTVFAPVNSAFEAIASTVAGLTTEQLTDVLTYHVASPANVLSTQLSDNQSVTALNGGSFTVKFSNDVAGEVSLTDANGNDVSIILTDVQATNGVIHVLNAVLLP